MKQHEAVDYAMRLLQDQSDEWGLALQPDRLALLRRYAELLARHTEANVIGTKDLRSIVPDHVLDSLSCLSLEDLEFSGKLIDVGSGGGLPGVPLAITQDDVLITLLEATKKKVRFLQYVQESLQLKNVAVLNQRAEEAGGAPGGRENYDIAVTRALASLPVIVEYCAPLVKTGGWILAMKGRLERNELDAGHEAAAKLGARLHGIDNIRLLPQLEQKQRQIVMFRKISPTPTGYPRRIGLAKKRPLGG